MKKKEKHDEELLKAIRELNQNIKELSAKLPLRFDYYPPNTIVSPQPQYSICPACGARYVGVHACWVYNPNISTC